MDKKLKVFYFLMLIFLNVYLLYFLFSSGNILEVIDNLASYIPTFLLTLTFMYQNIDIIFEYYNITLVYMTNPTVNWSLEYRFDTSEISEDYLNNLQNKFINSDFHIKTNNFNNHRMQLELDKFMKVDFAIEKNNTILDPDSRFKVFVKTNAKISYRDSLSDIFNEYKQVIDVVRNISGRTEDPLFILKVQFAKHNPFVKVIPKVLNKQSQFDYRMQYQIDETEFIVYNKTLEVVSSELSKIQELSKKYIALSNDKLFN